VHCRGRQWTADSALLVRGFGSSPWRRTRSDLRLRLLRRSKRRRRSAAAWWSTSGRRQRRACTGRHRTVPVQAPEGGGERESFGAANPHDQVLVLARSSGAHVFEDVAAVPSGSSRDDSHCAKPASVAAIVRSASCEARHLLHPGHQLACERSPTDWAEPIAPQRATTRSGSYPAAPERPAEGSLNGSSAVLSLRNCGAVVVAGGRPIVRTVEAQPRSS
jgi:hypothetical protein